MNPEYEYNMDIKSVSTCTVPVFWNISVFHIMEKHKATWQCVGRGGGRLGGSDGLRQVHRQLL